MRFLQQSFPLRPNSTQWAGVADQNERPGLRDGPGRSHHPARLMDPALRVPQKDGGLNRQDRFTDGNSPALGAEI